MSINLYDKNAKSVVFICGATATGKTAFAVNLAKKLDGEIISCDSMQIYRHMNVGTAKVTEHEMCNIAHHMIDIVNPNEDYSVAEYKNAAVKTAEQLLEKGKTPIFVGGTGLYANSVLFNYDFNKTKKSIREQDIPQLNAKVVILNYDRETLYQRIEKRVDLMFATGLEQEVRTLVEHGCSFELQSMKAIGYKEFAPYFAGSATIIDEVKDSIKTNSRRYAKRQLTWFRSWKFAKWFDAEHDLTPAYDYILEDL